MMAEHYKPDFLDAHRARWYDDDLRRQRRQERAHVRSVASDARAEGRDLEANQIERSAPSREWCARHERGGITIGTERRVTMINPAQKRSYSHCGSGCSDAFVLWFGQIGITRLHVYADSLETALEECAAWLLEHAPGHVMTIGDEQYQDLMREACEEIGVAWPYDPGEDQDRYWEAEDLATADFTRTESGFVASDEWGIYLENPTTEELYAFVHGD